MRLPLPPLILPKTIEPLPLSQVVSLVGVAVAVIDVVYSVIAPVAVRVVLLQPPDVCASA